MRNDVGLLLYYGRRQKLDAHLDSLEEQSIFILREAKAKFQRIAMLWSTGKDSTLMLALCRKAFFGAVPFPAIHIDNGVDFPETYALRERLSREWKIPLLVAKSQIKLDAISGMNCCGSNKTEALQGLMKQHQFDGLIVSIRRDEHGIRSKERYFSPRDQHFRWEYTDQPVEFLHHFSQPRGTAHVRIHPLLHWTELDIWEYIKAAQIPVNPLYFARNRRRFRSLGCTRCTVGVPSSAVDLDAIIAELKSTDTLERTGRAQDKEREYIMQKLRALGYM